MVKSPSKGLVPKRKFSHLALEGGEDSSSISSKVNTLHQFSQGNPIDVSMPGVMCIVVCTVLLSLLREESGREFDHNLKSMHTLLTLRQ